MHALPVGLALTGIVCLTARVSPGVMAGPLPASAGPAVGAMGIAIQPWLTGLRYEAYDAGGLVFRSAGATVGAGGLVTFALEGPAASMATVSAQLKPILHGFSLDWRVTYHGPQRHWTGWNTGLHFSFGRPVTGAQAHPVIRWVQPTGKHSWEVAGDTPYPETECQVREVMFGNAALAMVSSSYDPDWIYGNDPNRASFAPLIPPEGGHPNPPAGATANTPATPDETNQSIAFMVTATHGLNPVRLAAVAEGRPLSVEISTGRVGNLFAPGETVPVDCQVSSVVPKARACQLMLDLWSYGGSHLAHIDRTLQISPGGTSTIRTAIRPKNRGIIFVAAQLTWDGGETVDRSTIGILPDHHSTQTLPDSPFALAAVIANPEHYPDQASWAEVLPLVERIGVRWIRSGWVPLKADPTPADIALVSNRTAEFARHGILPYPQMGSSVPATADIPGFDTSVSNTISKLHWGDPYLEVGNELNFSTSPQDYVTRMLRPLYDTVRKIRPDIKLLSMGLGGVTQEWLDGFVKAGGMDLVDVLAVHPGCQPRAPEYYDGSDGGWVFRPQMIRAMQAAQDHGKSVWIDECYAPTQPGRSGVDVRTAADYLVRTYVCALALGVQRIAWYQFQDGVWFAQCPSPSDTEYNYGIVYTDLTPKPAYVAYSAMTDQLEGATCQGRLDLGADDLYGVRFLKQGQPVDVLWSYREKNEIDLAWWPPDKFKNDHRRPGEPWVERWKAPVTVSLAAAGPVTITDLMGNSHTIKPAGGKVALRLTGSPIYVSGLRAIPLRPHMWIK